MCGTPGCGLLSHHLGPCSREASAEGTRGGKRRASADFGPALPAALDPPPPPPPPAPSAVALRVAPPEAGAALVGQQRLLRAVAHRRHARGGGGAAAEASAGLRAFWRRL